MILKISMCDSLRATFGDALPDFDKLVLDVDGRDVVVVPMFGRLSKLNASDFDRVRPEALTATAEITEEALSDFVRTGSPAMAAAIVTKQIASAPKDSTFPIVVELNGFSKRVDGKWARLADLASA